MPGGRALLVALPLAVAVAAWQRPEPAAAQPAAFRLERGDHVCFVGNTLAERMQHDGWVETYLHARHPEHDLTVRNLGFSGDEVGGYTAQPDFNKRLRSQDFGSADQWLAGAAPVPNPGAVGDKSAVKLNRFENVGTNADVIFAFFGGNESWAGEAGLPKFKQQLGEFVEHVRAQRYNGKTAPQVVLFTPTAVENHKSPNLPRGDDRNKQLALYAAAVKEVAANARVPVVDLYTPTLARFAEAMERLTINGVHFTEDGNRVLAALIDGYLFPTDGKYLPPPDDVLNRIRPAVVEKNALFFQRYRATDGYSVFGGRAWLKFVNGQTNYEVAQRELEVIDQMVRNRDKVVWAAARGRVVKADDSNLPPLIPVVTNKPGKGPGGTHLFLTGEESIKSMTVAKGLKVTLFADEQTFPELINPVQMAFSPDGKLYVAVWPTYPHWTPGQPMNDKLLVLEDTNGDGKADKMTVFADGLHNPTGFEFANGGVLLAGAPDLWFLKDTDGDGKADVRQRVVHGLDTADTHHTANSFVTDPGGAIYFQEGTFHHSQVEDPYGPPKRVANGAVFRYEPRTQRFDVYVTFGFANPHGHVFDRWGQDIVIDGTGAVPFHAPLFSGHLPFPIKHGSPPHVYQQKTRPCAGMEVLSSRHFPPEYDGNLLVTNVIGFQGILRYKLTDSGSSLGAEEQTPLVSSTDPNFRPSDLRVGPDGAVYFTDWHNPIIGHMQHNLRDPSRNRTHGRVYKVTAEGREPSKSPAVAGRMISDLLPLLTHPEDRVRSRVRAELGARDTDAVMLALKDWVRMITSGAVPLQGEELEHALLEAAWLRQAHNVVDPTALERVLRSPDFRARAAAVRILTYQRERIPDALDRLKTAAADEHPRVRLMAVWGASYFTTAEAAEVVFIAQEKPTDQYLTFLMGETMKALEPLVRAAVAAKRPIAFTTPAGARYFLRAVDTDQLLRMEKTAAVSAELLARPGVRDEARRTAATDLAARTGRPLASVLIEAIRDHDARENAADGVTFDLFRLLPTSPAEAPDLHAAVGRLAATGKHALTRQLAFATMVTRDGVEPAWNAGMQTVRTLQDLVAAMPLVRDPGQRAELYPKVESLLTGLPAKLKTADAGKTVRGRFVRVELPGKQRTLTLAEVEVLSDGKNVALRKAAKQVNTGYGGAAGRAVDGNATGEYSAGTSTHTQEGTDEAWWEVDLGREYPIELVRVFNRTDGNLGSRLNNFTLKVLDADRGVAFQQLKNPAPKGKADVAVGAANPERVVRRSAMLALASVRGKEADAFTAVSKFVADADERPAAVSALLRIPAKEWPKDRAKPLLDVVMASIRALPADQKTTPAALDAMQFGEALAGLLPPEEARRARRELSDIGVRVVRVGTLTDQMLYSTDRLVVQAGRPVEFVFENTDIMPHNFVITRPGALAEVGNLAEAFATQPGAAENHYVPPAPPGSILLASNLLAPQQAQQLRFQAPAAPGVYPYVCTYPGHWRRMHGALYVVADLDAYLENPEAYLARNPTEAQDDLLKHIRPRTEWKFDDLAGAVGEMDKAGGRSFANGRQMFTVATCAACHKLGGQGNEFGPDLAKLDAKVFPNSTELLRHVLDPSLRIEDKFATFRFVKTDDTVVTGMILTEKDGVVKVIENPLAAATAKELKLADVASRTKAATSMMPRGLLDRLSRDEVLDLLAYVRAAGDARHRLFGAGHDHHH
ncbi:PVC-type heme-binding CxxCH protein [Urbifossiella limnaea]|uniref:Auracyanin-A n=1 Tax=Urbifossiella limnaea TaxID=2528023 RepID=A0A517XPF3_9BACT|nr:PVC-type heme-binding CxxCH protein [Urbifossiella limnaea]QDU19374.1 Auracyanin-A precursor [Urbifossiella limnaea]